MAEAIRDDARGRSRVLDPLKAGTKVRSKVTTTFGAVRKGDVVKVIGWHDYAQMYLIEPVGGDPDRRVVLMPHEFEVLKDVEA